MSFAFCPYFKKVLGIATASLFELHSLTPKLHFFLDSPCHIPCQMSACVFFEELSPLECPVYEHVPRSHVGAILGGVSGLLAVLVLGGLVWWKRDYIRDRIPYGRMNNAGKIFFFYPGLVARF